MAKKIDKRKTSELMGAPTKYRPDFHNPEFLRLAAEGYDVRMIAFEWRIARATIYEWASVHKDFSDTMKKGKEFSEGWYMKLGHLAMKGEKLNGRLPHLGFFAWMGKNMHNWSDKVEQTFVDERPLVDESSEAIEKEL